MVPGAPLNTSAPRHSAALPSAWGKADAQIMEAREGGRDGNRLVGRSVGSWLVCCLRNSLRVEEGGGARREGTKRGAIVTVEERAIDG